MNRLIFVGGGHAHALALLEYASKKLPETVEATLVSRTAWTPYSGMLPGFIAGHYSFQDTHIHLPSLCQAAGVKWIEGRVAALDAGRRQLKCSDNLTLEYDHLSIDIGSTPVMDTIPGAVEYAIPVKPVESFLKRWGKILIRLKEQETSSQKPFKILVVGSGAGGVEVALPMQHFLSSDPEYSKKHVEFEMVTQSEDPLPTHPVRAQKFFKKLLSSRGIQVHYQTRAIRVEPDRLHISGGRILEFDAVFWLTQATAQNWVSESGLATDERGFIAVNNYLQSTSHHNIFATGDIASMSDNPRAKAGVFAVRQGPILARNLRARIQGLRLRKYIPQKDFLTLVSTGNRYALGAKKGWTLRGRLVWLMKDYIDRKFMRPFHQIRDKTIGAQPGS